MKRVVLVFLLVCGVLFVGLPQEVLAQEYASSEWIEVTGSPTLGPAVYSPEFTIHYNDQDENTFSELPNSCGPKEGIPYWLRAYRSQGDVDESFWTYDITTPNACTENKRINNQCCYEGRWSGYGVFFSSSNLVPGIIAEGVVNVANNIPGLRAEIDEIDEYKFRFVSTVAGESINGKEVKIQSEHWVASETFDHTIVTLQGAENSGGSDDGGSDDGGSDDGGSGSSPLDIIYDGNCINVEDRGSACTQLNISNLYIPSTTKQAPVLVTNDGEVHMCGTKWNLTGADSNDFKTRTLCNTAVAGTNTYTCAVTAQGIPEWSADSFTELRGNNVAQWGTIRNYFTNLQPGYYACEGGASISAVPKYTAPPTPRQAWCAPSQCAKRVGNDFTCVTQGVTSANEKYFCSQENNIGIWKSKTSVLAEALAQEANGDFILNCGPENTVFSSTRQEAGYCQLAKLNTNAEVTEILAGVAFSTRRNGELEAGSIEAFFTELNKTHPGRVTSAPTEISGSMNGQGYSINTKQILSEGEGLNVTVGYISSGSTTRTISFRRFWNWFTSLGSPTPPAAISQTAEQIYAHRINGQTTTAFVEYAPNICAETGNKVLYLNGEYKGCYSERVWRQIIQSRGNLPEIETQALNLPSTTTSSGGPGIGHANRHCPDEFLAQHTDGNTEILVTFVNVNFAPSQLIRIKLNDRWHSFDRDPDLMIQGTAPGFIVTIPGPLTHLEFDQSEIRFEGLNNDGYGAFNFKVVTYDPEFNFLDITSSTWGMPSSCYEYHGGRIVGREGQNGISWVDPPYNSDRPEFYKYGTHPPGNDDLSPGVSATEKILISIGGTGHNRVTTSEFGNPILHSVWDGTS